jgi:polyferredoxin
MVSGWVTIHQQGSKYNHNSNRFNNSVMQKFVQYLKQPRQLVQLSVLLITIGVGIQFYLYVQQAMGQGPFTIQRPAGVEGFLPIGAFMGWNFFFHTGQWDRIHPAAMVIFGWAVLVSFLFRKSFCGWFCPIGTISEWLWRTGRKLFGRNFRPPLWIDLPLRALKYILLGFFLWVISTMGRDQISAFMNSAYYKLSDAKMLLFFTRISMLAAVVLLGLAILSMFIENFWCRYLCPYGALLGLFAIAGPTRIHRSEKSCVQCKACDRACPSRLLVSKKLTVNSPECVGCMACIAACPKNDTLAMRSTGIGNRRWTPHKAGVFLAVFFVLTVYMASISGHWRGSVSDREFRTQLKTIDAPENGHPSLLVNSSSGP